MTTSIGAANLLAADVKLDRSLGGLQRVDLRLLEMGLKGKWLFDQIPALNGESPAAVIMKDPANERDVMELLGRIEHGAY
jgi:hypothetical protein